MSKTEELEKRVEHLETEVELLKELVKLQNKSREDGYIPNRPAMPMQPYYSKEPTLEPPYKITCQGDEHGWAVKPSDIVSGSLSPEAKEALLKAAELSCSEQVKLMKGEK